MGNQVTIDKGMKMYIKQEFERVKDPQRPYLRISDVLKLQHPENYPFSFQHFGLLYCLDNTKSGMISLNQLYQFAQFCGRALKNVQAYEFQAQLQGLTTQLLWESISKQSAEYVAQWFIKVLQNNEGFETFGGHQFMKLESVQIIYEICNIKVMSSVDVQQFVDLLQQAGEESGLMSLEQVELDEYVSVDICEQFILNYLNGFKSLMLEIGFGQ